MAWYDEEFAAITLGDQRRHRRFFRLIAAWWTRLSPSIAGLCDGWAEQMAAYRFFASRRVTLAAILHPHRHQTVARVAREPVVLLVQDTTELVYEGKPIARGSGEVGPLNTFRRVGLQAHLQYALTPVRQPLGVLKIALWARETLQHKMQTRAHKQQPLSTKESYRWYQGFRTAGALARLAPATQIISVADREGDIYEVLVAACQRPTGAQLLVRACQDRAVVLGRGQRPQSLKLHLALSPSVGSATVTVPAGPGRTARTAQVVIHAQAVTFRPPERRTGKLPPVTINAVLVREVAPPTGEAPLDWLLLTTLPITSRQAVELVIRYYACRWEIEILFRLWKSGCHVEAFQWQTRHKLAATLALCAVFAWRLHAVSRLGQTQPEAPCTLAFTETEWRVIGLLATGSAPTDPPPMATLLLWVAHLGGFAGRRADGPPGPLVLMRGWLRIQEAIRLQYLLTKGTARCV